MRFRLSSLGWLAPLIIGALPALGTAQQVWTVDSQGRSGAQFADIPDAVAAAVAGDTLVVRDGNYSTFTLDKGLAIHAEPGAIVNQYVTFPFGGEPVAIENIPAGERVAVHGLTLGVMLFNSPVTLDIKTCLGQVHLEDVVFQSVSGWTGSYPGITITDCARVSLARCDVRERTGLSVTRSSVFAHDSVFEGQNETAGIHWFITPGTPGVTVADGLVELSRCDVRGGDTYSAGSGFGQSGQPAISLRNGTIVITGVDGTHVTAGTPSTAAGSASGHFALDGTGTALVDPIVALNSTGGFAPNAAGVQLDRIEVPSLSVSSVKINGQKYGDLRAGPGQVYVVMVGLPANPSALPFGNVWLDLSFVLVGPTGITGPSGEASWSYPAPTEAVFIGEVFTWQGAVLTSDGLRMTTAGEYVVR